MRNEIKCLSKKFFIVIKVDLLCGSTFFYLISRDLSFFVIPIHNGLMTIHDIMKRFGKGPWLIAGSFYWN